MNVNSSIYNAFKLCRRQAWLLMHQITGEQENNFLVLGRMIHENSYVREKKEIMIDGCKFDLFSKKGNELIVGEIKKSSKVKTASVSQLKFYLYVLSRRGIQLRGELRIPKEKKVISVELTDEDKEVIEKDIEEITHLREQQSLPKVNRKPFCKSCAYYEFCWS